MKNYLNHTFNNIIPKQRHFEFINFLKDDFKDTSEHLRETDRKLSILVQGYAGLYVLIVTIVLGLANNQNITLSLLLNWIGFLAFLVTTLFTCWLFCYALKSNVIKQEYILRMNFLRREIHYFLGNKNIDLPGYWTSVKKFTPKKSITHAVEPQPRPRVRLDGLYPIALKWIAISLSFPLVYSMTNTISSLIGGSFGALFFENQQPTFNGWITVAICSIAIAVFIHLWADEQEEKAEAIIKDREMKLHEDSIDRYSPTAPVKPSVKRNRKLSTRVKRKTAD